jgi:hypothetical protein
LHRPTVSPPQKRAYPLKYVERVYPTSVLGMLRRDEKTMAIMIP